MDKHLNQLHQTQLHQVQKKLCQHQFACDIFETKQECLDYLKDRLNNRMSVSVGGSMTLFETGIIEMLEQHRDIDYLDRYHSEDPQEIFHQAMSCDVYLTSSNAVTLNGELYNVDGNGNRVAAMIYGPKKVYVVCGVNKIVKDLDAAKERVRTVAAVANCLRLNKPNPCTVTGQCMDCQSSSRICSAATVLYRSHCKDRIHVLLINEELGY